MKLYNSNKIVKAIRGSKEKFDTLKSISQEILEVRKLKKKQEKFVEKSYNIVLRNLASSKKEVIIKDINSLNDKGKIYSVSKSGISKKYSSYSQNADNINQGNFFKSLIEVKENLPAFLKVLSLNKKTILKKFIEKANLLEEKKATSIPMEIEIDWVDRKKYIDIMKVYYTQDVIIVFGSDEWNSDKVNTIDLGFQDYAIIEQLYNQIKRVLEMELKQNTKELDNMKKFLVDIDKKFSKYIKSVEILNELSKGD